MQAVFLDGDDSARLIYLALLGAFIATGVLWSYRNRLSAALRDAAIWALIFVFTVIAYGLKEPLMAALYPDRAVQISERSVVLRRADDGHFHAELTIDGTAVSFLVDTGASDMVLTTRDAARMGIALDRLNFIGRASTANGEVRTAPVRLGLVRLGPFSDHDMIAQVNGGELDTSLLGLAYLDRFQSWSVEGDRMILNR